MTYQQSISKSITALVIINAVLLVYGAVILIDAGFWTVLRYGIGATSLGKIIFPLFLIPSGIMMAFMARFEARGRLIIGQILYLSTMAYLITIFTGLSYFALSLVHSLLPGELALGAAAWGVASGVSPWVLFAVLDRNNYVLICFAWFLMLIFSTLAFLVHQGTIAFDLTLWMLSWCMMAVCLVWQNLIETKLAKRDALRAAEAAAAEPATPPISPES